jgi:hypothetical protein
MREIPQKRLSDPPALPTRMFRRLAAVCLCCLLSAAPGFAATRDSAAKSAPPADKPVSAAGKVPVAPARESVYEQPPFTEKELSNFVDTLPAFLRRAREDGMTAHPAVNAAGKPDFLYDPEAAAEAQRLGWEPARFFCLMGRTAAALYLVEENADLPDKLPGDMPSVTRDEMALVRKHLASLLRAGTSGPPPALSR